jgi:hypothetical protein
LDCVCHLLRLAHRKHHWFHHLDMHSGFDRGDDDDLVEMVREQQPDRVGTLVHDELPIISVNLVGALLSRSTLD